MFVIAKAAFAVTKSAGTTAVLKTALRIRTEKIMKAASKSSLLQQENRKSVSTMEKSLLEPAIERKIKPKMAKNSMMQIGIDSFLGKNFLFSIFGHIFFPQLSPKNVLMNIFATDISFLTSRICHNYLDS